MSCNYLWTASHGNSPVTQCIVSQRSLMPNEKGHSTWSSHIVMSIKNAAIGTQYRALLSSGFTFLLDNLHHNYAFACLSFLGELKLLKSQNLARAAQGSLTHSGKDTSTHLPQGIIRQMWSLHPSLAWLSCSP